MGSSIDRGLPESDFLVNMLRLPPGNSSQTSVSIGPSVDVADLSDVNASGCKLLLFPILTNLGIRDSLSRQPHYVCERGTEPT